MSYNTQRISVALHKQLAWELGAEMGNAPSGAPPPAYGAPYGRSEELPPAALSCAIS